MAKMEAMARNCGDPKRIAFIAINTNDFDAAKDRTPPSKENLCYQTFVAADGKKRLVESLNIKRVPHMVLLDQSGNIVKNGKEFDWADFASLTSLDEPSPDPQTAAAPAAAPAAQQYSFSLDEDF